MTLRELREAAWDREGGRCIVSGQPLGDRDGDTWHLHHRRPKSMGGTSRANEDTLPNVIAVLPSAHREIHAQPNRSRPLGWLLSHSEEEPGRIPLRTWRGWRFLTDEGGYRKVE